MQVHARTMTAKRTRKTILCVGEVLVDLAAVPPGTPLSRMQTLHVLSGGSPSNVAIGISRLGQRASLLTGVGEDALGDWLLRHLRQERVDIGNVWRTPGHRTGLVFLAVDKRGQRSFL